MFVSTTMYNSQFLANEIPIRHSIPRSAQSPSIPNPQKFIKIPHVSIFRRLQTPRPTCCARRLHSTSLLHTAASAFMAASARRSSAGRRRSSVSCGGSGQGCCRATAATSSLAPRWGNLYQNMKKTWEKTWEKTWKNQGT